MHQSHLIYVNDRLLRCRQTKPLKWRHNEHDGFSNDQPHDCLPNCLFRRRSKKTSKLRVTGLSEGNSPVAGNSPHKGPVTRKIVPFDDVIKQLWLIILFALLPDKMSFGCSRHGWGLPLSSGRHDVLRRLHWPGIYGWTGGGTQWLSVGIFSYLLTHWGRDKMAAISQTTLSSAFSWMKMLEFRLKFHWSLFLRVQLTIFQHLFR